MVFGGFGAVNRDGAGFDELAGFAFAGSETSDGEGINERFAALGSGETLGE